LILAAWKKSGRAHFASAANPQPVGGEFSRVECYKMIRIPSAPSKGDRNNPIRKKICAADDGKSPKD